MDPQQAPPSPDLLGDLLGPLAIEGPPDTSATIEQNLVSGLGTSSSTIDELALATLGEQPNSVQVLLSTNYPLFFTTNMSFFTNEDCIAHVLQL